MKNIPRKQQKEFYKHPIISEIADYKVAIISTSMKWGGQSDRISPAVSKIIIDGKGV